MFDYHNKAPGYWNSNGRRGNAWNNITNRGGFIVDHIPSGEASRSFTEAHMRSLRLFRKICRMVPFVLRIHVLYSRVNPVQAKLHCARLFREKKHIRDTGLIDYYVSKGYDALSEIQEHYCQNTHVYQFLTPKNKTPGDRGFSFLDEELYSKKTKFLKTFYKGIKPDY